MPRTWRGRMLLAMLLAVTAAGAGALFLLRDPEPYFHLRRGRLTSASLEAVEKDGASEVRSWRLRSTSGLEVSLEVKWPTGSAEKERPLVLLLGGHRTGRKAVRLVADTGGAVVAAISYPYTGKHRLRGWEIVESLPRVRRALHDTPSALSLALDHLLAQPGVDPARVELAGVSLGAPFACIAGAIDPRPRRVWVIHGGGRPRRLLEHNLRDDIPSPLLRRTAALAAGLLIDPLAPEDFAARIAPRELVMVNAEDDEAIPRDAVEALFRSARAPKEQIWLPGGHVRPGEEETVRQLVSLVLGRVHEG